MKIGQCLAKLLRHVSQRVGLIVIPGCLFVAMFVCLSAPADGAAAA